jgi:Zn-dependent peptidase ImmA (M78 family)
MSKITIDENGVPVLSADAIELKAEEVIAYFDKQIINTPQRTPLLEYIEKLHKQFNLKREYNQSLGKTKHGNVILGKTQLKPLGLYIDVSLANDPRFNFVLGHELGHVVLHRNVDIQKTGYAEQEIVDTDIDFVTGKKNLQTHRDWLEWQANYFASAILMPRLSVIKAVLQEQKDMGIKRNLGRIILEAKNYSVSDYKKIQAHLTLVYSVNATNVECRLKDLGILIDRMNLNVQHVSELFTTE